MPSAPALRVDQHRYPGFAAQLDHAKLLVIQGVTRDMHLAYAVIDHLCPQTHILGVHRDGVFAEYVAVPVANLHAVPDDLSDERAVFAEPLAAAFEILEQVEIPAGCSCLVFGDGKLGHGEGAVGPCVAGRELDEGPRLRLQERPGQTPRGRHPQGIPEATRILGGGEALLPGHPHRDGPSLAEQLVEPLLVERRGDGTAALDEEAGGAAGALLNALRRDLHGAVGEALDFWRVEKVNPPHLLRLRAERNAHASTKR